MKTALKPALWSVYERGGLTAALPLALAKEIYASTPAETPVLIVRRRSLSTKGFPFSVMDPRVCEPLSVRDARDAVANLADLP